MSLQMVVGESFPRGFWMMDDSTLHPNYAGYGASALSASNVYGPSLVSGASRSLIVSNSSPASYVAPLFLQGKENLPFSLEAHFRPVISGAIAEQQVLGNEGSMDGLTVNGTVVSFVTKFVNTGEARASYDLGALQAVHAVGVHTHNANSLYINGELVAEIDITPAQQEDLFLDSGATLVSGASSSANGIMINAVAIYEAALDYSAIVSHYDYAKVYSKPELIASSYGGHLLEFSSGQAAPVFEVDFSVDEDWRTGGMFNVLPNEDTLYPESEDGLTLEGRWETAIPLEIEGTFYSAVLKWEGVGVIVQTSRDGATWTTAENGVNLSTVTAGTSTTDLSIFIRVSFDAGDPEYSTYLTRLTFAVYASNFIPEFAARTVTATSASPEGDYDVKEYHQDWGMELRAGTLTIKESLTETEPLLPKTIEVWLRKEGGTFSDNLISASPTTWRSNGGTGFAMRTGEWQLRHYVFNAGFAGDISFTGTGQVGHVILYPEALSNDTIKEIYDAYTGMPTVKLTTSDVMDISEFPGEVDIYEYDWTIESSG